MMACYGKDDAPDKEGTLMYSDFMISNQWFAVNDSAREHGFKFNEAVSLLVDCEDQKEIDYFWEKLSFVPEAEQCGWLKDKYGVAWQIEPKIMHEMMRDKDPKKVARVTEAFMQMKKFDVEALKNAYEGKAVKKMKEGE
jgi:predicted 3-demethylubiquinone-9 3-methyltransferase (glyoxalase superfamily)